MRKYYVFVLAIVVIAFLGIANAATVISPDNSNIQYTGRIDFSDPMAPILGWPGGHITVNFEGTSVKATVNNLGDGDGNTYYAAVIDDGTPVILENPAGISTLVCTACCTSLTKLPRSRPRTLAVTNTRRFPFSRLI